jgi:D-3-phosphoglycerate dehydrogenase
VLAYDPYVSELKMTAEGVEPVSYAELLARSDYLSVHPGLNDQTRGMLSDAEFKAMKSSAVVINCGRGPVIDEAAMIRALQAGEIAAAGLDVLEREPPDPDNPLLQMDNVLITPHAASATTRMRSETRRRNGREVALALAGKWPMSCVNPDVLPRTQLARWQPYPMDRGPNR